MTQEGNKPVKLTIPALDGYPLQAQMWGGDAPDQRTPVVIINPATSVHSRYYSRFAGFLQAHGFSVITYDYRGIGGSRPHKMRGFDATWLDWGGQDFEGVLRFVSERFPGRPVQVVAHSVGGFLIGMAPSNHVISRVFTMGSQFAYWKDYARHKRFAMFLRWHVVMPTLTAIFGYFPGKRLGWLEDTPRGVVKEWTARHPRFEDAYRTGHLARSAEERARLVESFSRLTGDTLAVSLSDDEFGTIPAIERLLAYFTNSRTMHLRIEPQALGQREIGHFAFFNARFEESLWQVPLLWLRDGRVSDAVPAQLITSGSPSVSRASAQIQSINA